jgi:hypothetical protein
MGFILDARSCMSSSAWFPELAIIRWVIVVRRFIVLDVPVDHALTGWLGLLPILHPQQAYYAWLDSFFMRKKCGQCIMVGLIIVAWTALNGVYLGCPKLHVFKCMVSWAGYDSLSYCGVCPSRPCPHWLAGACCLFYTPNKHITLDWTRFSCGKSVGNVLWLVS